MPETAPILKQLKCLFDQKLVSVIKKKSFVIPPSPIIIGQTHMIFKFQPDLLWIWESMKSQKMSMESLVDEGAPGSELLDSNDDMDEDNEIPYEIPNGVELAEAPPDVTRSLSQVFESRR
jgi:hypothetical protein